MSPGARDRPSKRQGCPFQVRAEEAPSLSVMERDRLDAGERVLYGTAGDFQVVLARAQIIERFKF